MKGRTQRAGAFSLILICLCYLPVHLVAQSRNQSRRPETELLPVPFVGCSADGQTGPVPAPKGASKLVQTRAEIAQRLAFYKSEYTIGVLAPRDWHCVASYGSSGSTLLVTPQPIKASDLLSQNWSNSGPSVLLRQVNGGTSGRFEVAQLIARVFPARKAFAQQVISEGLVPASDFPFGPFPNDKLSYNDDTSVEYETPPRSQGLGTVGGLRPGEYAVRGVALLDGERFPNLLILAVRLSSEMQALKSPIIDDLEMSAKSAFLQKESKNKEPAATSGGHTTPGGLQAHDVNGFALDMSVQQVVAVAGRPLTPLGGGQFKVSVNGIDYDFGFSARGHLFRIDSKQQLGRFIPDAQFTAILTEKLSKKYGPPQHNQLPGGPAFWQYLEAYTTTGGQTLNRETESLSAMLSGGYGVPISLEMKLMDFRIMRRDIAKLNATPRSKAEGDIKF